MRLRNLVIAQVFARDEFRCRHCGTQENLHIDHVTPRALGGGGDLDNLQLLCRTCNLSKGARPDRGARDRDPAILDKLSAVAEEVKWWSAEMREARRLRGRFVLDARREGRPWPAITAASGGIGEAYLRREMEDARRDQLAGEKSP